MGVTSRRRSAWSVLRWAGVFVGLALCCRQSSAQSVLLSEGFEGASLDSRISVVSTNNFTTSPGIVPCGNFGSTNAFGFGISACPTNCFDQYQSTLRITFPTPTFISTLSFKEMELQGNWGSTGYVYADTIQVRSHEGALWGRRPENDQTADSTFRMHTFEIFRLVSTIDVKVSDITSGSELVIDDIQVRGLSNCQCVPVDVPAKGFYNPATLAIDTCDVNSFPSDCNAALGRLGANHWNEKTYAYNAWVVEFLTPALWLPRAPFDSLVEVTWAAIDTNSHRSIRASFAALEDHFGPYVFQKIDPADTGSWRYRLVFDSYFHRDSVLNALSLIDSLDAEFGPGLYQDASGISPFGSMLFSPRL